MPKPRKSPASTPAAGKVPAAVSAYMAEQQAKSAASLRGTETARQRAAKAGRSISPEAAHLRAIKANAARTAKNKAAQAAQPPVTSRDVTKHKKAPAREGRG